MGYRFKNSELLVMAIIYQFKPTKEQLEQILYYAHPVYVASYKNLLRKNNIYIDSKGQVKIEKKTYLWLWRTIGLDNLKELIPEQMKKNPKLQEALQPIIETVKQKEMIKTWKRLLRT